MRATVMYGAHDVRVESVGDARLIEPTDALVRVTRACICGSDLWPYNSMAPRAVGNRMGHEFIGVVESVGADVRTVKKGDLVVAPFAWRLGAERIIMLGRHADRIALARRFGATDVVSERGDAAIERVRELTGGLGAHSVLECVGHGESTRTAVSIARAGGAVGRVGVPQETTIPNAQPTFFANITIAGGPAPVRAYMHELMPDALEGRIEPGLVFDRITKLDGVPDGYRAMNDREAIKVMIEF